MSEASAKADPNDSEAQRNLSISYDRLGNVLLQTGATDKALEFYIKRMELSEWLAKEHAAEPHFTSDVGVAFHKMSLVAIVEKRFDAARDLVQRAIVEQKKALAMRPHRLYRQCLRLHLEALVSANKLVGDAVGVAEAEKELAKLVDSDPATVALDVRMSAVMRGEQQPKDGTERLAHAQRAYD